MKESSAVSEGILAFYSAFSAGDPDGFAAAISSEAPLASVIGSSPDEGHEGRAEWIATYEAGIPGSGIRLEGGEPSGYEQDGVGWGVDRPAFVMPDGSRLPTRMTAVLRRESGGWKIVHLHFSVGVPDEEALQGPEGSS